jgi:hypothetical protein
MPMPMPTMAETVGIPSLTPSLHSGTPRHMNVVIVAFPGVQSLDAIGPFEVFASATRVAAGLGRNHLRTLWFWHCRDSPPGVPAPAERFS